MRLILPLLLLLQSCGKNAQDRPYYEINPTSLEADSDGDGMLDWDEKFFGRDPFLADVNEVLPPASHQVTLLDEHSREVQLPSIMRRTLRDSLMLEIGSLRSVEHPRVNSWHARIDHTQDYWRARFANFSFKKIRFESNVAQILPPSFSGQHTFVAPDLDKRLQRIELKTYRLVISTPVEDKIFHLSPQIDLREFVIKNFKSRFDVDSQVVQINEDEQHVSQSDGLDYHTQAFLWRTVGMPLTLRVSPQAGRTYAIVFGAVEEFRRAALHNANLAYPEKLNRQVHYGHETSVVAFFPRALQARWKDKFEALPIRIGNGDRERTCEIVIRKLLDYQPRALTSAQQALSYAAFSGAQNVRIDWTESGEEGLAAKFTMDVLSGDINASLTQETVPIGLIKSYCVDRMPLKIEHLPVWRGMKGYFSWLPES